MQRWIASLLFCCALALSGCGTVQNLSHPGITQPDGGTCMKCYDWCGGQNGGFAAAALWPFWLIDKPFCLVADTITLPDVLCADGTVRGWWEVLQPTPATKPAAVDASPSVPAPDPVPGGG